MVKKILWVLFAILFLGLLVPAQQVKPALPAIRPAAVKAPPATTAVGEALPQPTELERVKLENIELKMTLLQKQQQELQAQFGAWVQTLEAEHPGWAWNPASQMLVKKPVKQGQGTRE